MLKRIRAKYKDIKWWFFYQNWFAGKIIELLGNEGEIAGLKFDLDNPYIATFLKSRFLFKTYEYGSQLLISKYVNPCLPVVEFGGCIGVMSCLMNRLLENPSDHVVVEAQPFLIDTLRKNRDRNSCQFEIIHAALAYGSDSVEFWIHPRYFIGNSVRARAGGEAVRVPSVSLETIVRQYGYSRITLVVDVEGAETTLVANELDMLRSVVDTLIVELHPAEWCAGAAGIDNLKATLADSGFKEVDRVRQDFVYKNFNMDQVE